MACVYLGEIGYVTTLRQYNDFTSTWHMDFPTSGLPKRGVGAFPALAARLISGSTYPVYAPVKTTSPVSDPKIVPKTEDRRFSFSLFVHNRIYYSVTD